MCPNRTRTFGRPFRADSFASQPRDKALGCSVRPFHGQDKGADLTARSTLAEASRLTSRLSPFTSHLSLLLSRHLLRTWLGTEFVGEEREDIGLVSDLLIQRTPDAMSK